ncbi:peptidylprolyl isomerase [Spirosoma sp. KCTC 42546]|uniref:peptidylprolyl isomerase n=1 Tax=Spirosoma sp. KCTC 42546 TaxID=2520506 RepID=UPI00115A5E2B|nr:peptidylprolyl isomerase [Spirosoma sp. KCTC 42546]QDK79026.1 peptidylprolyl isomerase [Spirosoma sp. KCTC 42546]
MRHLTGGFLLALLVTACKTTAPVVQQTPPPKPVILTLGNKPFTTDDFFQSFTKNQLSSDSTQRTDVKGYFDLYTNLKLKVLAAETEGRDTTEAFREEMNTYRKQLAQSYLTDKVLVEALTAEAYQHMQEDVNASHILLSVSEDALPADTLKAYQSALALRKQALAGEDFSKLAREYSQDAATAQTGGSLGYITAFGVVYPLEIAAYTTPVGSISQPVRTRFGYHLIKVNNRRPSRGRVRVAHILVRMSPGADEAGQKMAQNRIDAAYTRLQKGESFELVCRELSDDATSKSNGGVLPLSTPDRPWVPAFDDAAFALTKVGDYSKPVRTNYGWHIIKLIERKALEPYATMAAPLRQRVMTDSRAEVLRQSTVQKLRKDYTVQEDKTVLENAVAKADSSLLRGQWRFTEPLDPSLQNKPIVTISGQPYTVNQFFAYVRQRQQPPRNPALATTTTSTAPTAEHTVAGSPSVAMYRQFDRFVGDRLIATEEANLDKKSAEFKSLMSDIRDGVLLSQVMEQNVWERSMVDSTGQRQYYEQHKAEYRLPERAIATLVIAQTDSLLKQASSVFSGKPPYQLRRSAAPIAFDKNQTALTPAQRETLFDLLVVLGHNPDYVVEVTGSHDPTERDSVSAGRIRNVVGYLQKNGISLSRIMEKDYQGARPGVSKDAQRNVTFQYFSNAKDDVAKIINSKYPVTSGMPPALSITEGSFAQGTNPYLDSINQWKVGTTTLHRDTKAIAVIISRIEPARTKTFAEARGTVINEYQALLEKQWLAQLRQTYPVKVNEAEIQKLVK